MFAFVADYSGLADRFVTVAFLLVSEHFRNARLRQLRVDSMFARLSIVDKSKSSELQSGPRR
jgi:hypothetical protein